MAKKEVQKIEEHEKRCRIMQKQTHDKIHNLEHQINRVENILLERNLFFSKIAIKIKEPSVPISAPTNVSTRKCCSRYTRDMPASNAVAKKTYCHFLSVI